jgi:hypothetical protein
VCSAGSWLTCAQCVGDEDEGTRDFFSSDHDEPCANIARIVCVKGTKLCESARS